MHILLKIGQDPSEAYDDSNCEDMPDNEKERRYTYQMGIEGCGIGTLPSDCSEDYFETSSDDEDEECENDSPQIDTINFDFSLYESGIAATPLHDGADTTVLQALVKYFLWFILVSVKMPYLMS